MTTEREDRQAFRDNVEGNKYLYFQDDQVLSDAINVRNIPSQTGITEEANLAFALLPIRHAITIMDDAELGAIFRKQIAQYISQKAIEEARK